MAYNKEITNSDIAAGAAIALSKLSTDPLARANHTGTQAAATISDFNTAADARVDAVITAAPYCHVRLAGADSIGSGVTTKIPYDTITKDTHAGWSLVNDNYVCPETGIYLVTASLSFIVAGVGVVGEYKGMIYMNGSRVFGESIDTSAEIETIPIQQSVVGMWELSAGSTIDFRCFQNTGSARSLETGITNSLIIRKIGEAP